MRALVRRLSVLFGASALAVSGATAVTVPAAAAGDSLFIANAASYETTALPRGALFAIYPDRVVSVQHHGSFNPWTRMTPDGLWVEATCAATGATTALPILYAGFLGPLDGKYNQINVYFPNAAGPEPWGGCAASGPTEIRVHSALEPGTVLTRTVPMVALHPGAFLSANQAPTGSIVANGSTTPLSDCNVPGPSAACRPALGAELTMLTTGADAAADCTCASEVGVVVNRLAADGTTVAGPEIRLSATAVTRKDLGTELLHVPISTLAAGTYRIRAWNVHTGASIDQGMRVELE